MGNAARSRCGCWALRFGEHSTVWCAPRWRSLILACPFLQADINDKMRAILIDWLVEVHLKFKVCSLAPPRLAPPPEPGIRS